MEDMQILLIFAAYTTGFFQSLRLVKASKLERRCVLIL